MKIDGHCHCDAITFEAEVDPNAFTPFPGIAARRSMPARWDNPQVYALRAGTITQRAAFKPRRQGWRRSAPNWVDSFAAAPAAEKGWSRSTKRPFGWPLELVRASS